MTMGTTGRPLRSFPLPPAHCVVLSTTALAACGSCSAAGAEAAPPAPRPPRTGAPDPDAPGAAEPPAGAWGVKGCDAGLRSTAAAGRGAEALLMKQEPLLRAQGGTITVGAAALAFSTSGR